MAVSLVATIQRFQGLSTDTRPEDPPEGSTFHVIDTGALEVYHDGAWEEDKRYSYALTGL